MFQETVGMLLEPERGVGMQALGTASRRVASCRMRTVISRSDLVAHQWISQRKAVPVAGGRSATNRATGGGRQTCG